MRQALPRILTAFACGCLLTGAAYAAPVELDPPDLAAAPVLSSSLVQLDVTAGISGAPNGFTIQWMTLAEFNTIGGWPADPLDPRIHSAIFLGTPTLNTVDGTTTCELGPGALASIQIGDIFDETGVQANDSGELASGTDYVFRVQANGDPGLTGGGGSGLLPSSPYSHTQQCHTKDHDDRHDCVHSQGYWKEHPSAWPVTSLQLGNVIYTKAQLLQILNKSANGNGLISLAHQLIAARLNIATGAVAPTNILGAISTADALIGGKIVPPVGAGFIAPGMTSHLADDLEEFNDDEGDHHACQMLVLTRQSSWGDVKGLYR